MKDIASFSQYLPVEEDALRWGLHVVDAGFTEIPPDSPYPPGRHPDEYHFSWKDGRTLQEYQLVYITRGCGMFETAETGRVRIEAGQAFLLFPDVWHRYHPVRKQGWDESWIGFNGDVARRIMKSFFSPNKAVIPHSLRRQAHLTPGSPLQVTFSDGTISITRDVPGPSLIRRKGRLVAQPQGSEQPEVNLADWIEEERNRWPR